MKKAWILFLFTSFSTILAAQQLQLLTYDMDEGLSRGLIKSVITDDLGFVWSATDEGVIRFDGQNPVFFREFLPGGFAKSFYKRRNGQFLAIHDLGILEIISKPDTTYFKQFLEGSTLDTDSLLYYPKILYEDQAGKLWIGEQESVVRYASGKITKFRFDAEDRAYSFYRNFSFAEDQFGILWTISYNGHLFYFDVGKDSFVNVPLPLSMTEVASMTRVSDNVFFIGAKEGLFRMKAGPNGSVLEFKKIASISRVSSGIVVNENEFYLGSFDQGLYRANLDEEEINFTPISPLPFPDIMALHFDQHGLWVCSSEAIGLLHPVFFGQFPLGKDKFPPIESIQMATDGSKSFVVSSENLITLVEYKNGQWEQGLNLPPPSDQAILHALKDKNGIWVGSFTGEIHYYDFNKKSYQQIQGIRLRSDYFSSDMLQDKQGNTWFCGNRQDGLIRIDSKGVLHKYPMSALLNNSVIAAGLEGQVIVNGRADSSYLFRYDPAKDQFVDISLPLPFALDQSFSIFDLFVDGPNSILLGTSKGLLIYEMSSKSVRQLNLQVVPEEEPVRAIAKSPKGTLWLSTSKGLVKYEPDNQLLFDPTSGLPSRTLKRQALQVTHDGTIWVGTARGLSSFREVGEMLKTPQPILKSLRINGQKADIYSEKVRSFPYRSYLEADFISLSYPGDLIKYQYRILEIDSSWSPTRLENQVFYSSFEPGRYTFQVRAQKHGGLEWSTPRSYIFEIEPAWYQTWWAIFLFVAGFGLLLTGIVRLYNLRLIQQKKHLEKIVKKRTEEINAQKNMIIEQKNEIIQHKEELIKQGEVVLETQTALANAELKNRKLKEKQLQQEIEHKNKQLTTTSLRMIQKNKTLKELANKIGDLRKSSPENNHNLRKLQKLIDESFRLDKDWDEFKIYFEQVYTGFYKNLKEEYPNLTNTELRHCTLIKLNLSISECANILGISPESVKISRFRLKKKMNLPSQNEVRARIMNM